MKKRKISSDPSIPKEKSGLSFVFFGTGEIAVGVLEELSRAGLPPALVVTAPDKRAGRNRVLTPPPVKSWALAHGVAILQPEKLNPEFCSEIIAVGHPIFVVVDYGKILPRRLLDIPSRGTLNMHPSLLPRLRGPSPIRSAILNDGRDTGVSVIVVDEELDHGPLVAQRKITVQPWPPRGCELDRLLSREGGKLLATVLPLWYRGEIEPQPQNHDVATHTRMFQKEDGLLNLSEDPHQNLLKIRAFDGWPGTYTFFEKAEKRIRVQILDAHIEREQLILNVVRPEGKKEMGYADFARGGFVPSHA